ncbi:DNA-directed DNA polymerase [Bertholletia excelsa]
MAMGFSAQPSSFKPSSPPIFDYCSCACSSHRASHFSRSLWTSSTKSLQRECNSSLHDAEVSSCYMNGVSSMLLLGRSSRCQLMTFGRNYSYCHKEGSWKLKFVEDTRDPSTLVPQMVQVQKDFRLANPWIEEASNVRAKRRVAFHDINNNYVGTDVNNWHYVRVGSSHAISSNLVQDGNPSGLIKRTPASVSSTLADIPNKSALKQHSSNNDQSKYNGSLSRGSLEEVKEKILMLNDTSPSNDHISEQLCLHERLACIYDKVLVVDNVSMARKVVGLLINGQKHRVYACDTEVARINVKQETPVDHGEIICFSIYSGPELDFGHGSSCIWVDVLSGDGKNILAEFAPFFEDRSIKKVWHNYSFDNHVLENYGLKLSGFHADTMHMARLWDSSRWTEGER